MCQRQERRQRLRHALVSRAFSAESVRRLLPAMYHDQGHGPIKVLGLEAGVNIAVGLPIIRTSVDHGTAFDIAGTGKADPASIEEAVRQAIMLSGTHHSRRHSAA
ncbi:hypothetical protein DT075_12090 [Bacillus licheniformis]|nr:hypothetical protein DT075_12090 [Bacillus licheniformis]